MTRLGALALSLAFLLIPIRAESQAAFASRRAFLDSTSILEDYRGIPNRDLDEWTRDIAEYSKRHYGVDTWKLEPTAIVLHYTAGSTFPLNLIESSEFMGEAPGVASHFVIDEENGNGIVYQLLPLDVMSRATFGANYCSISIEMVARDEADLLGKKALLDAAISLVRELMARYGIPASRVYGHAEIDAALAANPRGAFFDNTIVGAFVPRKSDPGVRVMATVRSALSESVVSEAKINNPQE